MEIIKDCSEVVSAFGMLIVTGIVTWIAFWQYKVNRERLKNELFKRRYDQFDAVKTFLGKLMSGQMDDDVADAFLLGTKGIRFTYSKEIYEYVDKKVWGMGVDLNVFNEDIKDPKKVSEGAAEKRGEHMKQIINELRNLECKFIKYLQLKH